MPTDQRRPENLSTSNKKTKWKNILIKWLKISDKENILIVRGKKINSFLDTKIEYSRFLIWMQKQKVKYFKVLHESIKIKKLPNYRIFYPRLIKNIKKNYQPRILYQRKISKAEEKLTSWKIHHQRNSTTRNNKGKKRSSKRKVIPDENLYLHKEGRAQEMITTWATHIFLII